MSKFSVAINTNGAAFASDDSSDLNTEVARILRELAEKIDREGCLDVPGPGGLIRLRDINGNKVGFAVHEYDDEDEGGE